jgi:hypothetical protein
LRPRPYVFAALLAAAATVMSLGAVEVGLRVADVERRHQEHPGVLNRWVVSDPILVHRNAAGAEQPALGVHLNALGFPGPEPARPKPPGTVRIVCLGDSATFGFWQGGPDRFGTDASYTVPWASSRAPAGITASR